MAALRIPVKTTLISEHKLCSLCRHVLSPHEEIHTSSTDSALLNWTKNIHSSQRVESNENSSNVDIEKDVSDAKSKQHASSKGFASLNSLNLELPRLGDYERYIPFGTRIKQLFQKDMENIAKKVQIKREIKDEGMQEAEQKTVNVTESSVSTAKEEHSFENAMKFTNTSIEAFYDIEMGKKDPDLSNNAQAQLKKSEEEASGIWSFVTRATSFGAIRRASTSETEKKKPVVRKDFISRTAIDNRTRALVKAVKVASSNISIYKRLEFLCLHLIQYPDSRSAVSKEKLLPHLLKLSRLPDKELQAKTNEALALIGYVPPLRGRGIKVLTIDGGGTRGLLAIETMKKLEQYCKKDIHTMFDYVCGVSTGALIATLAFLYKLPLKDCEQLYKEFSAQMFSRNRLLGTGKLMWSHAFYDTEIWEKILKDNVGDKIMVEFSQDPSVPKMSAASTLMNVPKLKNFMFRTYNLPANVSSHYPGNCRHKINECIRASSAAPGYYEEYMLGDFVHYDGGLMTNNPAALALHESKLLWPQESIQCVVSLGNGRYEPNLETNSSKVSIKDKLNKIVDSATDTEAVHMTLQSLLPPSTYYRFNPYLSEEFFLDEIRPDKIEQMQKDSQMYLRKNEYKLKKAAKQLMIPKNFHQKLSDVMRSYTEKN